MKIRPYLPYLAILLIALFIVSGLLTKDGIIGHRLDWTIPIYSDSVKQFFTDNIYKWRIHNLGYQKVFYTNFELSESIVGLLGYLGLSPLFIPILLIYLSISIAGIGFILFLKQLNKSILNNNISLFAIFVGGVLYSTSYAFFNQILGGNWGITISAAFFPLLLTFLLKYIKDGSEKDLTLSVLFLCLSITQIHYIFYLFIVICFYLFAIRFETISTKRLIKFSLLGILINMFWVVDFISIFSTQKSNILSKVNNSGFLWSLHNGKNTIMDALTLTGRGNFDLYKSLSLISILSFGLSFLIIILSIFLNKNRKVKNVIYLCYSYVFFFILIFTGFREPFGYYKNYLFQFPGISFFKSPQHSLLIISFFLTIILTLGISVIVKNKKYRPLFILLCIGSSYNFFPWLFTDNFNYYPQSKIIEEGTNLLKNDTSTYKVMFLPSASAPYIPEDKFEPRVGADADTFFFIKPTFSTEDTGENDVRQITERALYENKLTKNDLLKLNVRYIFLRNDRMHGNVAYGVNFWNWNDIDETYNKLYKILQKKDFLSLVEKFKNNGFSYSIWKVKSNISEITGKNLVFKKINPTQYSTLFHLSKIQPLDFLESFHPGWKLYLEPYSPLDCKALRTYTGTLDEAIPVPVKPAEYKPTYYTVKRGDSYERIALTLSGVTLQNLKEFNPSIQQNQLRTGMQIIVGQELQKPTVVEQPKQTQKVSECEPKSTFYAGGEIEKIWQKPIFDETHTIVYDYANQWMIDPMYIKKNFSPEYYKENPDGSIDVRLTLYFKPQSYFYIGLAISLLTFLGCIGYLGILFLVQRKYIAKE